MKKMNLSLSKLIAVMALAVFVTACSSDNEGVELTTQDRETEEVAKSSEIDKASSIMDDIAISVYESQEQSELSRTSANFNMPDCVTITVVIEQNYRQITIDFGTEGCQVHGNILMGKMILTYERDPEAQEISISKMLEDFYFNNKNILGGKTILKQLSNENGNPQFTKTTDITVIWPNGAQASRTGLKVREWIEGFGSGVWSDNVFEVTGNWSTTFVNGNTHSYEVVIPLRREVICYYFVSGSVDVERTNFSGVFDYGEGDCDNQATFTFDDGEVIDIVLN